MLNQFSIEGYRSLKEITLNLSQLTLIQGGNGTGESNIYRSLEFMVSLANGTFAEKIIREGGMQSVRWLGESTKSSRLAWHLEFDDFQYKIALASSHHDPESVFRFDPCIDSESLSFYHRKIANRRQFSLSHWNDNNEISKNDIPLHSTESILSLTHWFQTFPAAYQLAQQIKNWRFYHEFPCHSDAPARHPQIGSWSPILHADASNLCATIETMRESFAEDYNEFREILTETFMDEKLLISHSDSFQLFWQRSGLKFPLPANAISDGTLRFICLLVALCSSQKPPLLVLNEPENSLDERLLEPLARCISRASKTTQIIIVTHSEKLTQHLLELDEVTHHQLILENGATRLASEAGSRRSWKFK